MPSRVSKAAWRVRRRLKLTFALPVEPSASLVAASAFHAGGGSARTAAARDPLRGQNQPIAPYPRGDTSPRTTDHPELEKGAVRQPRLALRLQIRWVSGPLLS